MARVEQHDAELGRYLYEQLRGVGGLQLYGPDPQTEGVCRTGLVAFNAKEVHSADLSFFLDQEVTSWIVS
jgi:selenocysteine lyase/cysteine desulfurase